MASTGTTTLVVVLALLVLAALMVLVAVWLVRATRRDPTALGPLEAMGDRSWRKVDPGTRSRRLAAARPAGAPEPAPVIEYEPVPESGLEPDPAASGDPVGGDDAEVEGERQYAQDDG